MADPGPPYRPGGGWGGGGGSWAGQSLEEARRACRAEARYARYEVRDILSSRPVRGSGGRVVAAEVVMRVRDRGRPLDVRCDYRFDSGRARLAVLGPPGGGGAGPGRPDMGEARRACTEAAGRRGYDVRNVLSTRPITEGRGRVSAGEVVMRVRSRGTPYNLRCEYTFRTGRAELGRPVSPGGSAGRPQRPSPDWTPAERREAIRACRSRARVQGLDLREVVSTRPSRAVGGGRGGVVILRISRGGRLQDVRCDYDFRTGAARLPRF
jgi:hypothetical protein